MCEYDHYCYPHLKAVLLLMLPSSRAMLLISITSSLLLSTIFSLTSASLLTTSSRLTTCTFIIITSDLRPGPDTSLALGPRLLNTNSSGKCLNWSLNHDA